jgi:hypothetical protein
MGSDYQHFPTGTNRAYAVGELLDGVGRERHRTLHDREMGQETVTQFDLRGAKEVTVINSRSGEIKSDAIGTNAQRNDRSKKLFSSRNYGLWRSSSLICGLSTAIIFNLFYWIESIEFRLVVSGTVSSFALAYLIMSFFSPERFYHRLIYLTVKLGFGIAMGGVTFDAFFAGDSDLGWFRWNGSVSTAFYFAWPAIVLGLIGREWWQSQQK